MRGSSTPRENPWGQQVQVFHTSLLFKRNAPQKTQKRRADLPSEARGQEASREGVTHRLGPPATRPPPPRPGAGPGRHRPRAPRRSAPLPDTPSAAAAPAGPGVTPAPTAPPASPRRTCGRCPPGGGRGGARWPPPPPAGRGRCGAGPGCAGRGSVRGGGAGGAARKR